MSPSLSYTLEQSAEGHAVLTFVGEIDTASADLMAEAFERLERGAPSAVVLDLSRVDFIDSSGLRLIVAERAALVERGASMSLGGLSGAATRVLEITGLIEDLRS